MQEGEEHTKGPPLYLISVGQERGNGAETPGVILKFSPQGSLYWKCQGRLPSFSIT